MGTDMRPVVAVVGRPNVGKSTLFNAIVKKNIAIVHDIPGVTRDRNYTDVMYDGGVFTLIDTGGFDPGTGDDLGRLVQENAHIAVEEADLIIFLMDGREGLLYGDMEIARILQRTRKPVLYVVNKVEGRKAEDNIADFYRLGIDELLTVSAKHRTGIAELIDTIYSKIPRYQEDEKLQDEIVVSIIGRPNVGKSSLINKIVGQERLLVSDRAGTTRDPVDSIIRYHKQSIRFIDTAGIRRKNSRGYALEKYCTLLALRSISRSMVCVLVIDASQGVTAQDAKLAAQIYDRYRACIVVLNKWDLLEKNTKTHDEYIAKVRSELAFIDFAPIVVVSALTGFRARKILDVIVDVWEPYMRRVATGEVNRELQAICSRNPPPGGASQPAKILYATQVAAGPPTFKLFTNNTRGFPKHYQRFLERRIRERFGFENAPICLQFTGRKKS